VPASRDPILSLKKRTAPNVPEEPARGVPEEWWPMTEVAQLGLFAENPFRTLGLRVFAAPGEIARRVDDLAGGAVPRRWAFASRAIPDAAKLSEAAQTLKGGLGRLFAEFFWFWPENYPEEKSDPAIEALARGDMETACDHWETSLPNRRGVAAHNLAVLFHLAALDHELARTPVDDEVAGWWAVAGEHWNLALADDEIWVRLESRIKRFDDPRVPADFARRVRQALPGALVRVHTLATIARAEKGDWDGAAALLDAGRRIWSDAGALRRGVEAGLEPLWTEAEAVVDEKAKQIANESRPCLPYVEEMLRRTAGSRRVADILAELGGESGRQLCNHVVELAVTGISEHRRRTRSHSVVLPWLVHLATLPAAPDVASRVAESRNSTLADVLTARLAGGKETDPTERLETGLRVMSEVLIPAASRVEWWDARTRSAYLVQVGVLLRELAHDAFEMLDEFDLSSRAFELAAEISGPERRSEIMAERRKLWRQFMSRHKEGMCVEHVGHVLEIDPQRLVFNGAAIANAAVSRVRFGLVAGVGAPGLRAGWCAGKDVIELDSLNLFAPDDDTAEIYQLVIDSLQVHVLPGLVERLVEKVKQGESVVLGGSALRPEGFVFRRRSTRENHGAEVVPYDHLKCEIEGGDLVITSKSEPAASARYSLGEVWNAVAMTDVVARLTGKA
jgi:hypothetical protein